MEQTATPMGSVQTLAQRKQARVEEIRAGVASLREALAAYGRAHGGRFLIYGSAVSGRLHYDSDVDLLVDFPAPATSAALDFVEETCARLKLKVDVQPKTWCKEAFLARIVPQAQVAPSSKYMFKSQAGGDDAPHRAAGSGDRRTTPPSPAASPSVWAAPHSGDAIPRQEPEPPHPLRAW